MRDSLPAALTSASVKITRSATDADTGLLHEGFHVDDPKQYTREWFTWPCSLFAEFVERCVDEGIAD